MSHQPKSLLLTPQFLFQLALAVAGLALLGWGTAGKLPVLAAVGGAMFGSTIGTLLDAVQNTGFRQRLLDLLSGSLAATIRSEEYRLTKYRRPMYYYHVTERGRRVMWRCDKLDFGTDATVGSLTAVTHLSSPDGLMRFKQVYTGAARDKRLVLLRHTEDIEERAGVAVFPHIGEQFVGYDCGLVFKQTWDGRDVVAPCILSFDPIARDGTEGFVEESSFERLSQMWHERFWHRNAGCGLQAPSDTPMAGAGIAPPPGRGVPMPHNPPGAQTKPARHAAPGDALD